MKIMKKEHRLGSTTLKWTGDIGVGIGQTLKRSEFSLDKFFRSKSRL